MSGMARLTGIAFAVGSTRGGFGIFAMVACGVLETRRVASQAM